MSKPCAFNNFAIAFALFCLACIPSSLCDDDNFGFGNVLFSSRSRDGSTSNFASGTEAFSNDDESGGLSFFQSQGPSRRRFSGQNEAEASRADNDDGPEATASQRVNGEVTGNVSGAAGAIAIDDDTAAAATAVQATGVQSISSGSQSTARSGRGLKTI